VTHHDDGRLSVLRIGDRAVIVHADPRVIITADMITATRRGLTSATLDGDLLRVEGETHDGEPRTVVYRIGPPTLDGRGYHAEWPD
jgi:hypothetical protein